MIEMTAVMLILGEFADLFLHVEQGICSILTFYLEVFG